MTQDNTNQAVLDSAVAEGGAYEILRRRLQELGGRLQTAAADLNARRLAEFGRGTLELSGRVRIRTENNCLARDIVRVGDMLLFGCNVFLGLKRETRVEDVFSLYRLEEQDGAYEAAPLPLAGSFLDIPAFVQEFGELYKYYKNTRLLQLAEKNGKLLAAFQIGERHTDIRVFRWSVSPDYAAIKYIDNRGERDISLPPRHDFEWVRTTREDEVNGRYPHFNILDTVFVETVGGDLTIKLENNTEDGLGIYREPVLDENQSLGDASIEYARIGSLILLKMLPYREEHWRYFVYNTVTHDVKRIDAIGQSCIQLPEDHGIIFPGGYYLQNGEYKTFGQNGSSTDKGMLFRRLRKSSNGEDVLYAFYEPVAGRLALFNYNMIERQLQNPLRGNGYTVFDDGRMVFLEEEGRAEPSRVHPMQIWQTPYYSDEYAARARNGNTVLGRIGNAELVRGISDLYNLARQVEAQRVSAALYAKLGQDALRLFDRYFWLKNERDFRFAPLLREVAQTSELVLDEYEKAESIRVQSARALAETRTGQRDLFAGLASDDWGNVREYADALGRINIQRGRIISLRALRYMDQDEVDRLEADLAEREAAISRAAAEFLAGDKALAPFEESLAASGAATAAAAVANDLLEPAAGLDKMSAELDMLSSLIARLSFDDVRLQTRIIENISEVFAKVNQARSRLEQKKSRLGRGEAVDRFGARFKLFGQSIASALALATDPERCDDELSRLLLQLEELESRFSAYEVFQPDILRKREELLETFETRKQALLDERQRRSQSLLTAAGRILSSFGRRTARLALLEEINAFFVADPMARKVLEIAGQLRELKDSVRADDLEARFKAARDQALRGLRDKTELFEDGGSTIRLGPRHRFSVNTQELDLTIVPKEGELYLHLTGTDYLEPLRDAGLDSMREFWDLSLESESPEVCRAEYLAYSMICNAGKGEGEPGEKGLDGLYALLAQPAELEKAVRAFSAPRYAEGYEKGIHDHDAMLILQALLPLARASGPGGLLRYSPRARALGMLFWRANRQSPGCAPWPEWAKTALAIRKIFKPDPGLCTLQSDMEKSLAAFALENGIGARRASVGQAFTDQTDADQAAEFLCLALAQPQLEFPVSKYARQLVDALRSRLLENHHWTDFNRTLKKLGKYENGQARRWDLALDWLRGLTSEPEFAPLRPYAEEAAALLLLAQSSQPRSSGITLQSGESEGLRLHPSEADLQVRVSGLLGQHPRIQAGVLELSLPDFFGRLRRHRKQVLPGWKKYQAARQNLLAERRSALRLEEFKPRPLSSFVRNRLIDQVYLPLIGDNLAKQIGAAGAAKRTDLMGLLMLISPPGYGKTTLMEYVAHCLGLIFMKINGPALGHSVISLDPDQAPDATARQELQKLNLALEMGNNVMLYLDDIQHTNPEFLQKFISLCDATRRMEGVWMGRAKTYDFRGKKFCVVMAGNPYTESGEVFKIPDMLANRADIYNLGEVLGGQAPAFALSYLENALTSSPALAPLARRDMNDLYHFIERVQGKAARPGSGNDLSYGYSEAETAEIVAVLERLLRLREVVMAVNRQYIDSAAQAEQYRTEPPFKLQGSYRSMNKLAEQVSAVMNAAELERLVDDFYTGEAQLLTEAAEENLLKLDEIRGRLSGARQARWEEIKKRFVRNKAFGGENAQVGDRVVAQLADLVRSVQALRKA
ncbi:MAG: DNA repair ATPase [Deltaproteobacteria bacterium]|jgi:hypothetical protein|nr:DNA repair ATPase [Deltaproteobacteria bacterium]